MNTEKNEQMEKKRKTLARRLTSRLLIWTAIIALGLSYLLLHFARQATRQFYSEIYRNKMLITNEYTRRVISDVYVAVTNNIYYLEHSLDKPDEHKKTMERIVKSGTRVRSCGISFIKDYYYPQKEHRFCPFAWRNVTDPDVIYAEDMGDADLDYLGADWFLDVLNSDSAQWSEPFYDGYDEKTTLSAYMVPIHDPAGRVVAVLGADISLDWLANKLKEADSTINNSPMFMASRLKLRSKSFIINHDGSFLTHSNEERIMKDSFYDELESCDGSDVKGLIKSMQDGVEDVGRDNERFLVNGEECYLFYIPVKYTRWLFVTIVPCRAIDILSYLNGITVVLIVILAVMLVVIICHYYIKNGTEPLQQLIAMADSMAKGKLDSLMPDLKHNDEIKQLADSIENMRFTLSNYVDEHKHPDNPEETT